MARFCSKCGKEISDGTSFCLGCGSKNDNNHAIDTFNDKGGFLWGLFGYFAPIAGLILFIMWRKKRAKTAKAVGIGALIYAILYAVLIVFIFVLAFGFGFEESYDDDYFDYYDYGYNHRYE